MRRRGGIAGFVGNILSELPFLLLTWHKAFFRKLLIVERMRSDMSGKTGSLGLKLVIFALTSGKLANISPCGKLPA